MSSRNFGVGSHLRFVPREENPLDDKQLFENWDAKKVKEAWEGAQRADQAAQDRAANQQTGDAFIAGHPELLDTVPNAKLLVNQMNTMFGTGRHPLEHYEQSYQYLRENTNFLALDKNVLASQQKQVAKQRYEQERIRMAGPSEQELYEMPLEDLRRLDATERQKQMQREGERGGNGF